MGSTKGIVSEYINANWCGYLHFELKVVAAEIHEGTIKIGIVWVLVGALW